MILKMNFINIYEPPVFHYHPRNVRVSKAMFYPGLAGEFSAFILVKTSNIS